LKNDLLQYLSLGFLVGTAALFMAQPQQARADILNDLALDEATTKLSAIGSATKG
jgi:hypothetical protein